MKTKNTPAPNPRKARTGIEGFDEITQGGLPRGERTLFISFDADANEVVRNLASVNIRLARFVKKGLLRLVSARTITGSAENHLMHIRQLAREHGARCLVIDPVSALAKAGNVGIAHSVAERLIDWAKVEGLTLLCTNRLDEVGPQVEGTPLQVSTIADTWIHLNYLVHAGERNRGLSIIKSRGTGHSNQVRELVLSNSGLTLADACTVGGEVLMGTMRWEKERAARFADEASEVTYKQMQTVLAAEEALLVVRLKALQLELEVKRAEQLALTRSTEQRASESASVRTHLRELRGADKK